MCVVCWGGVCVWYVVCGACVVRDVCVVCVGGECMCVVCVWYVGGVVCVWMLALDRFELETLLQGWKVET